MLKRLLLALVGLTLSLNVVQADEKPSDQVALLETVSTFKSAMGRGDFDQVMSFVPEKVFGQMAKEMDISPEYLNSLVVAQMEDVLEEVKILEFDMETSNFDFEKTEAGIVYAFLPTRTVIDVQGAKVESRSHTLALRDGRDWRLVRIDDTVQLKVLRKVYPGFAEIEFPRDTLKLLN